MRRLLALLCCVASACFLSAQSSAPAKLAPTAIPSTIKDLPVRKVVLYKNGVGYFEHSGTITGNQRVAVDFTSAQLNDVLQSLTVLDEGGGRIAGVNYNSTTPIEQQLKTLALGLKDFPPTIAVYQALRGQRVEVTGAGAAFSGRLVNVEFRAETDKAGVTSNDHFYLIVATDTGALRTAALTDSVSVRMLDPSLQKQFANYLEIVGSAQNQQLRHLVLDALGQGQRQLRVSYISEVPVWKSTYRIVFPRVASGDNGSGEVSSAIVQGWAVVDNTVGADWDDVQLSLVAGAPQSFIQPLSQPLYIRRPEIPIATTEQSTPQTHEAAEMKQRVSQQINGQLTAPMAMAAPGASSETVAVSSDAIGGTEGGSGSAGGVIGRLFGGSGSGYGVGGGAYRPSDAISEGDVSTNAFDDFFQYALAQPVTIHKNESAMVPILQQELPAEHVTLWSASERSPLRALWLENKSKLTLDAGSFSIFESGEFAGEGLLDPIHPGEKRLLSYAVDQAVQVRRGGFADTRTLHHIAIHDGIVVETTSEITENSYTVSNAADQARTVIIEHARKANAEIDSEPKPAETTATAYRFRVAVKPHDTVNLHVGERANLSERIQINPDISATAYLTSISKYTPDLEDKLKPLIAAGTALNDLNQKIAAINQREQSLSADEARDRENLTALKGNDAAKRFVEELNRAEDDLQTARKDRAALEQQRDAARASLSALIAQVSFDTDLSIVTQSDQNGIRPPRR